MRRLWGLLLALLVLSAAPALADKEGLKVSGGKHVGDREPLEYEIVYLGLHLLLPPVELVLEPALRLRAQILPRLHGLFHQ